MKRYLSLALSLFLFCFSLTILFLSMRAVLGVGGSCAEGGAYQIAQHCPGSTAWLTPLSVWVMVGAAPWYFVARSGFKQGPHWGYLFWSALFLSLGYNFLEYGFFPSSESSRDIGFIVCGMVFWLMGGGPIVLFLTAVPAEQQGLSQMLFGSNATPAAAETPVLLPWYQRSMPLLLTHCVSLGLGIWLGLLVFRLT